MYLNQFRILFFLLLLIGVGAMAQTQHSLEYTLKSMQEPTLSTLEKHHLHTFEKPPKPYVVILIDDIAFKRQLKAVEAIGLSITPSIFPPHQGAWHSERLAQGLSDYMVHLPMESSSALFNAQAKTLFIHDSEATIQKRAKEIRQLFPTARFINNHTGSRFTANYLAMKRLYGALRQEGFIFVDSRTIGNSKVKAIAKRYGDCYMGRDVFLDNQQNSRYIRKQIQHLVAIAKAKGYAIGIGHPHRVTLKTLKESKGLFKGVEVVYIEKLYEWIKEHKECR